VRLLPYLEQAPLYQSWHFKTPANNVTNNRATSRAATAMATLVCPSDLFAESVFQLSGSAEAFPSKSSSGAVPGFYAGTSYAGNYGEGSYFTKFSQFPIKPNGIFFLTGSDATLAAGTLHPLVDEHRNLEPVKISNITDGTSSTLMVGEKYHADEFFDSWTSENSSFKMYQVSAWAWTGGMKGAAHVFCSSAVPINSTARTFTDRPDIGAQDRRYNAWGSGHVGGACFALCDGSVRFIQDAVDAVTLSRLSTRAGDEIVDASNY
jgi:hypothetical protein